MFHTILFDVIGTTVKEKNNDTVTNCLHKAFHVHAGLVDASIIIKNRGRDKITMINEVLNYHNYAPGLALPVYKSFQKYFGESLDDFAENDGCAEIFAYLKTKGIKIGLGTGLSENPLNKIMQHLRWNKDQFDYIGIAEKLPNGRPEPDMIFDMMRQLKVTDSSGFLKVGDTVADIQEGKNAHVATAVILSGSQQVSLLIKESPDYVFTTLSQLKGIIK